MKRFHSALCVLTMTATAVFAADVTPVDIYPTVSQNGSVKQALNHKSAAVARAASANDTDSHSWVEIGKRDYTDDILTSFFDYLSPTTYQVTVQKDEANQGIYRIVDPWSNHPDKATVLNHPETPGVLGQGDDYFIIIDASNPEYVRILNSPIGVDDGYGVASLCSRTELVGEPVDFYPLTQAEADLCAGKLVDNVITFTKERSFAAIQDGSYYPANGSGAFRLDLNEPKAADTHKWVDLGLCDYVDDIATAFFDTDNVRFKVKVQKDEATPGFYRIVDPWANYPYKEQLELDPMLTATFPCGDEYYILIDATNPNYVRVLDSPIGMDDGDGPVSVRSLTELVGVTLGYEVVSQEKADLGAGRLVDNVITFNANPALILLQDGTYYPANRNGAFALALPGGKLKTDYNITVTLDSPLCPDHNNEYHVTVSGDENIPSVRYAVMATLPEKVDASFFDKSEACTLNQPFSINVSDAGAHTVYALFATFDENNEPVTSSFVTLAAPEADSDAWEYFGKAEMTEGFMSCTFSKLFDVETYEVDIERRKDNAKVYRIVNPYGGNWSHANLFSIDHAHNHYIYINAENDNNVYIEYSPIGVSVPGNGECAISSDYINLIDTYGLSFLEMFEIYSGGSIKDNILTFDNSCDIKLLPVRYGKWVYTNIFVNPDYDPETMTGTFDKNLAGNFKLDLNKAFTGIENIAVDSNDADQSCEYYNLQGVKVNNPSKGVFIVRSGNNSVKKYIP